MLQRFPKNKNSRSLWCVFEITFGPQTAQGQAGAFYFLRNFAKFCKIGPEIFQKKSYYCIGFSGAKRGSTLNIWRGRTRGKIERAFRSRSSLRSLLRLLNLISQGRICQGRICQGRICQGQMCHTHADHTTRPQPDPSPTPNRP